MRNTQVTISNTLSKVTFFILHLPVAFALFVIPQQIINFMNQLDIEMLNINQFDPYTTVHGDVSFNPVDNREMTALFGKDQRYIKSVHYANKNGINDWSGYQINVYIVAQNPEFYNWDSYLAMIEDLTSDENAIFLSEYQANLFCKVHNDYVKAMTVVYEIEDTAPEIAMKVITLLTTDIIDNEGIVNHIGDDSDSRIHFKTTQSNKWEYKYSMYQFPLYLTSQKIPARSNAVFVTEFILNNNVGFTDADIKWSRKSSDFKCGSLTQTIEVETKKPMQDLVSKNELYIRMKIRGKNTGHWIKIVKHGHFKPELPESKIDNDEIPNIFQQMRQERLDDAKDDAAAKHKAEVAIANQKFIQDSNHNNGIQPMQEDHSQSQKRDGSGRQ